MYEYAVRNKAGEIRKSTRNVMGAYCEYKQINVHNKWNELIKSIFFSLIIE
jgi:hypothetical protein